MTGPDHIARLIQLDPSETGSGFDAPDHNARTVQHFETAQGRAEQARRNADRGYRNWRIALVFCAACSAAIIAMIFGLFAWHIISVTAGNLAAPVVAPW